MLRNTQFNLIFDFDGTLADSFSAAMQKFDLLADEFNFHKIKKNEIEELRDLTSRELLKYLKIPLFKLPYILQRARKYMHDELAVLATFPELPEVLTELQQLNCCLGILTSNSAENVILWLEYHKMRHLFNFIHTESSYFGKKHLLKKIMKARKMDLAHTFYVGDETRDVEAAQKCRINSIAVSWGFNSVKALIGSKPNYIVRTPSDILTILKDKIA